MALRQPLPSPTANSAATIAPGFRPRRWHAGSRGQVLVAAGLVLADVLLALAVWQVAVVAQGVWGNGQLSPLGILVFLPNVAVWVGLRALMGLYPGYGFGQVEELRRQTFALLTTVAITMTFAFASNVADHISRLVLFGWVLGLLVAAPFIRGFAKWAMMKAGLWGKPVVIFGAGEAGTRILEVLRREWQFGLNPVGVFDNRYLAGEPDTSGGDRLADLGSLAREHGSDTAIFAMPDERREHLARFVGLAGTSFRSTVVIPDLGGITNSATMARDLAGTFGVEIQHNLLNPWAQRLKRALDLVATLTIVLLALPLLLVLCVLVKAESRGPVFYKDLRMGRDGKLFPCLKFRTMVPDAEALLQRMLDEDPEMKAEYLEFHKLRRDPRITRVGRLLRKTSLDELPQIWNVLRGEMSLVGPRPYLPRESEDIGETQGEILRVTPGITGPWQVAGRSNTTFTERVRMDVQYVHDWSVWLDVILLVRTVRCLLSDRSAC